jgi:hypothetical protein
MNMDMKSDSNFYMFISSTAVTVRDVISRMYIADAHVQNSWRDMKPLPQASSPPLLDLLLLAVAGCRPNERKTWFTKRNTNSHSRSQPQTLSLPWLVRQKNTACSCGYPSDTAVCRHAL